jgi:thioredoxin 1
MIKNHFQHTTPHQEARYEPPPSPDDVAPPATPTIMIFKNGEKKDAIIGSVPKTTLISNMKKFLYRRVT